MASVALNTDNFRLMYPSLTESVLPTQILELLWDQACSIVGNDDSSFSPYDPEKGVKEREVLLYLVTCHLATLASGDQNQAGRLTSVSEGSVSASFEGIKANSVTAQWWLQTRCGATYWALTAKYRLGGRLYCGSNFHPWG